MTNIVRTGVRVTAEDLAEVLAWNAERNDTPVVRVAGRWLDEDAEEWFHRRLDDLAERYGLPKLPARDGAADHYGILRTGEFTRVDWSNR